MTRRESPTRATGLVHGFPRRRAAIWPSWSFHSWAIRSFRGADTGRRLTGLIFNLVFVWPIIERKFTNDNAIHNLLDRPSNRPKRTAAGVTMLSFLGMLFIASSTDVLAKFFNVSLNDVLVSMRYLTVIVPISRSRSPIASATRFRRCTAAVDVRPRTSSRALKRVSTPPRRRRAT